MYTYTQECIDAKITKCLYGKCDVKVDKLSQQDVIELKKNYKEKVLDTYITHNYNNEPDKKNMLMDIENEEEVPGTLKLVLSGERETDKLKFQIKPESHGKDNPSTIVLTNVVDVSEIQNPIESSTSETLKKSEFKSKIKVLDTELLFDNENATKKYYAIFDISNYKPSETSSEGIQRSITPNSIQNVKIPSPTTEDDKMIKEAERLCLKYFRKPVYDTIMIMANIVHMMIVSTRHHQFQFTEAEKKRTRAETFKERRDAREMYSKHTQVLEAKLKLHFFNITTMFAEDEFELAFQLFFLSLLSVLRCFEISKFRKGGIFKFLVVLLMNSLKINNFEQPKIFELLISKKFRKECVNLITLIEDCNTVFSQCAPIFFITEITYQEHFKPAIDILTGISNEDLEPMIDCAIQKSRISSQFNETANSLDSLSLIQEPVFSAQNPVPVESVQQWPLLNDSLNTPNQPVFPVQQSFDINPQSYPIVISAVHSINEKFFENTSNSLNQCSPPESEANCCPASINLCLAKDCADVATITCKKCQSIHYCSVTCQTTDWYASHIDVCAILANEFHSKNNPGNRTD